jgi:peptidoglycan/LPS O-acetylase OafA/YrhL
MAARLYLQELLFVQNYLGGVYLHTWSLAIEEHFYVLLMLCFVLFGKQRPKLFYISTMLIVVPLGIRLWRIQSGEVNNHFLTHTRIDSLFAGVLLQYLWRYKRAALSMVRNTSKFALLMVCSGYILSYGFVAPENSYVQGIGFTLIALCFAGILWVALSAKDQGSRISKPLSFIGYYSYSVYLLHIPVKWILEYFGMEESSGSINLAYFAIYALLCVMAGVAFSEMIEQPILRWRDRRIPSKA